MRSCPIASIRPTHNASFQQKQDLIRYTLMIRLDLLCKIPVKHEAYFITKKINLSLILQK